MKLFVILAIFIWLVCGFFGAWMLEGGGNMHLKTIARGPISLVKGFNENPVSYPGPG
jgi:hypothetical protein